MILKHLAERNDEWLKMAHKFSAEPKDALQDAYLKMYYRFKDTPDTLLEMDRGQLALYMYLTIRSTAVTNIKDHKRYADPIDQIEDTPDYDIEEDRLTERKLDALYNEMNTWYWYDKKLVTLHLIEGMSMREISRETGISLSSIFHTIKTCKQRLLKSYEG